MWHAHNVKVECNNVEYTKTFLCSDLLYFLWHGINTRILVSQGQECLIKLRVTNSLLITDVRWVTINLWHFRVMFQSPCLLTQLPITPCQRNLKTEVLTWKHIKCVLSALRQNNLKPWHAQQSQVILDLGLKSSVFVGQRVWIVNLVEEIKLRFKIPLA